MPTVPISKDSNPYFNRYAIDSYLRNEYGGYSMKTYSEYGDVDMSGYRRQHGIAEQLPIIGDDWLSERDKKSQARADAAVKRTGLAAAKKLEAAADALNEFLHACLDASHEDMRGASDGRRVLINNIMEYSSYLDGRFGSKA